MTCRWTYNKWPFETSGKWFVVEQNWFHVPKFLQWLKEHYVWTSTNGMNPYGNLSSKHSSWSILLVIYNLPPWLCNHGVNHMLAIHWANY